MTITCNMFVIIVSDKILLLIIIIYKMYASIIRNKNKDALVAASNAGCESCDHTTLVLCGHMTWMPSIPQCASGSIEQVQLQVM